MASSDRNMLHVLTRRIQFGVFSGKGLPVLCMMYHSGMNYTHTHTHTHTHTQNGTVL